MFLTKRQRYFVVAAAILLLNSIPTLIGSIRMTRTIFSMNLQEGISILNQMIESVTRKPINHIVLVSQGQDCPSNFSKLPLGEFSGTSPSCYCKGTEYISLYSECSIPTCVSAEPIHGKPVYNWRNYSFCANYTTSAYLTYNATCKDQFRKCGNYLCVDQTQDCPITKITLQTYSENSLKLTTERDPQADTFILSLDNSLNGLPCLGNITTNTREGSTAALPFLRLERSCKVFDTDAQILDRLPEDQFYILNDLYDQLKSIPLFESSSKSQTIALVTKLNLQFSDVRALTATNCSKLLDESDSYNASRSVEIIDDKFLWIMIRSIVFSSIAILEWVVVKFLKKQTYFILFIISNAFIQIIAGMNLNSGVGIMDRSISTFFSHIDIFVGAGKENCFKNDNLNEFLAESLPNTVSELMIYKSRFEGFLVWNVFCLTILFTIGVKYYCDRETVWKHSEYYFQHQDPHFNQHRET